jgi:rubrerythrin
MKMTIRNTILSAELDNIQRKENEMYQYYSDLARNLKEGRIKEKIKKIRDQELGHISMATKVISILMEYIKNG